MEKIYKESIGLWQLRTDKSHILHRIGSDDYTEKRDAHVSNPVEWEELALSEIPPYTKAEYDAEVERLIAERYSPGKEIEVNREHDTKPEQFAAYMAYIEECKARAVANLTAKNDEPATKTKLSYDTPRYIY